MTLLSWQIEFARPLWLATLAALPLWIVLWRRSLVRLSVRRRVIAVLLRTVLLAVLAAGLAGPAASGLTNEKAAYGPFAHRVGYGPAVAELAGPVHARAGEPFALDLLVRSRMLARLPCSCFATINRC